MKNDLGAISFFCVSYKYMIKTCLSVSVYLYTKVPTGHTSPSAFRYTYLLTYTKCKTHGNLHLMRKLLKDLEDTCILGYDKYGNPACKTGTA